MSRPLSWLVLVCTLAVAGCTFDESGLPAGGDDAGSGPGNPDATSVACRSNTDCAAPPDACHLAGTCGSDGMCSYAPVDCSSVDSACSVGQCDLPSGECVAVPVNEAMVCDSPIVGEWSECAAEAMCSSDGSRQRLVAQRVCTAGACTPTQPVEESETCTVPDVAGSSCGPATCGDWGDCGPPMWGGSQCGTDGERSRSCSGSKCSIIGSCDMTTWTETEACVRNTDGNACIGCWTPGSPPSDQCECNGGHCVPSD